MGVSLLGFRGRLEGERVLGKGWGFDAGCRAGLGPPFGLQGGVNPALLAPVIAAVFTIESGLILGSSV
ncbi:MAG: hypothetical protein AAGJ85_02425 [Pseudomonadota bacterium]